MKEKTNQLAHTRQRCGRRKQPKKDSHRKKLKWNANRGGGCNENCWKLEHQFSVQCMKMYAGDVRKKAKNGRKLVESWRSPYNKQQWTYTHTETQNNLKIKLHLKCVCVWVHIVCFTVRNLKCVAAVSFITQFLNVGRDSMLPSRTFACIYLFNAKYRHRHTLFFHEICGKQYVIPYLFMNLIRCYEAHIFFPRSCCSCVCVSVFMFNLVKLLNSYNKLDCQ